jgi:hypothetical protein
MEASSKVGEGPLIRARFCQEWLAMIAKEEEPYRGRFLARVSPETRAQIETASRVGWLPLSIHVGFSEIQLETFGIARAHDYYRRAFAESLRGPVLGPLMMTAARLLGLSPASFVKWAPRGYDAGFRNAGQVQGEVLDAHRARLVYSNLPAMCTASDAWMTSSQGSAYGAYDVLGVEGVVRLDTSARAEGKMVLALEWSDRKRPA